MKRGRTILHVVWVLIGLGGAARAGDEWSDPFTGVRYLHRTTDNPKWSIHLCFVDLTEPSNRVTATTPENKANTVSGFARKQKAQIAVNGDFFNGQHSPGGLAIGEGKLWPGSQDNGDEGVIVAGPGNRAEIFPPEMVVKPEPWMQAAVSGRPLLVRNGAAADNWEDRHPRTAVGLTKDRRTLILLVVDGRQQNLSVGMKGSEMQAVFLEFGAWMALNLDGGGSTSMYIDGKGVVNSPSDGRERVDANHLGIYAVKGPVKPKGRVRGWVKEKGTGKPLPNAKVALSSAYFDTTDAQGVFDLSQVPAGQPALNATLAGYVAASARVKVAPHATVEVTIEMSPPPPPAAKITPTVAGGRTATPETGNRKLETGTPAPGGEDATRLLARARNYQKGRLWGKALDAYQAVVKQFPDSAEAAAAKDEIAKLEAILAESATR